MEDNLYSVLKPGRYINQEWNSIHKEWERDSLKVALCFPDIYEIGMSHLGMRILYDILNKEEGIICERVFAPWGDMEKKLRSENKALCSLESKNALNKFDIIGFSLQYEMNYPDVLNMLDLGGVAMYAKDRCDTDPLVIAGGPCAFNPEVMADFIDAFVIGEAEDVILEIARLVRCWMLDTRCSRSEVLSSLSKIKGVYVPVSSIEHRVSSIKYQVSGIRYQVTGNRYQAPGIQRRIIEDLDASHFPTSPIVPYIQIVHDRISIEIMRGCPHKCRFCQACKIFHPLRARSVKSIMDIAERSVRNTGYEEISLLSLSSGDYPYLEELVRKMEEKFRPLGIKVSLPSLRVKSFDEHSEINVMKRSGLTFAPEAGSERLRNLLNKKITNEDIIEKSRIAFNSGWRKVKLYFMIGLPGEEYGDLEKIIELALKIKNVNLSISSFIPKPHSEFEREGMEGLEVLKDKRRYLCSMLDARCSMRQVKMDFHSIEMAKIEAVLSRGDRKVGEVIFKAWQKGARLQAWTEYFNYSIWEESLQESGISPEVYLSKRGKEEVLPWSFIEM